MIPRRSLSLAADQPELRQQLAQRVVEKRRFCLSSHPNWAEWAPLAM